MGVFLSWESRLLCASLHISRHRPHSAASGFSFDSGFAKKNSGFSLGASSSDKKETSITTNTTGGFSFGSSQPLGSAGGFTFGAAKPSSTMFGDAVKQAEANSAAAAKEEEEPDEDEPPKVEIKQVKNDVLKEQSPECFDI